MTTDVAKGLLALKAGFESEPSFAALLKNPVAAAAHKQAACDALIQHVKAPELLSRFVATLIANDRIELLPYVANAYRDIVDAAQSIIRLDVTSATALSKAQLDAISKAVAKDGQRVEIETTIDASLLGGVTIRHGSRLLDASLNGQLNRLASQMKQASTA